MLNLSVGGEITLLRWVGFYENGYSRSFFSKNKRNQGGLRINNISLWNGYLTANRMISELSTLYKCSERTIRRRLSIVVDSFTATYPKSAVIILDTTYFSRTFGVMLFQDASSGKILYRKFVKNETNRDYLEGLRYIAERGTMIKVVVCYGHVGLLQAIHFCPVQTCQFHQFQIVRRLLTNNPHLPAGVELLALMRRMFSLGKEEFITAFDKPKSVIRNLFSIFSNDRH